MKKMVGAMMLFAACLLITPEVYSAGEISQAKAIQLAKRYADGRVLKIDEIKDAYKVKVLQDNGRVVTLRVDKRTGKVTGPGRKKD